MTLLPSINPQGYFQFRGVCLNITTALIFEYWQYIQMPRLPIVWIWQPREFCCSPNIAMQKLLQCKGKSIAMVVWMCL
ncbi:unnamed protein product [Oppiella nova]|uniref:Uncharacterized protein n=1 Tax=Oppiella nova TaxID=334625 RepID=A0A7R9LEA7_9ACAR|nr:unnamed protein product [Oppiella nova]CAG2162798.1 unnamed protein product [Oppiella nova]